MNTLRRRLGNVRTLIVLLAVALCGAAIVSAASVAVPIGGSQTLKCRGKALVYDAVTETEGTARCLAAAPFNVRMGSVASFPGGHTIKVLSYKQGVLAENPSVEPAAGRVFALIEVLACAGRTTFKVEPYSFDVETAAFQRFKYSFHTVRTPEFPLVSLAPHDCVRGYVPFEVDPKLTIKKVLYTYTLPDYSGTVTRKWAR